MIINNNNNKNISRNLTIFKLHLKYDARKVFIKLSGAFKKNNVLKIKLDHNKVLSSLYFVKEYLRKVFNYIGFIFNSLCWVHFTDLIIVLIYYLCIYNSLINWVYILIAYTTKQFIVRRWINKLIESDGQDGLREPETICKKQDRYRRTNQMSR